MLGGGASKETAMDDYLDGAWFARLLLQRGVAAIYLFAFVSAWRQFPALLGERGLLPVRALYASHADARSVRLPRASFWQSPSLFHWHYSDRLFVAVAACGSSLACVALSGASEWGPAWLSLGVWLVLWVLYLSIVNVGQVFYGFGWETLLLEAGFLTAFLGPSHGTPSLIPILALRWLAFRTEFGAGLIKIRHDSCWRDLTCLYYHYQTQPLPNALSSCFHRLPRWIHRTGVAFSHFVQLVAPFGLFLPQPVAAVSACLLIAQQLLLVVSGNYAWLNWLTIVIALSGVSDGVLQALFSLQPPPTTAPPLAWHITLYALAAVNVALAYAPARNFFSRHQRMNASYNSLHLGNSYGAFGSVTREREEVIVEGSPDGSEGSWRAYEFKAKPGDPRRRPPQVAPYHLRLDWMMWFLPLGSGGDRWFVRFACKLLEGDPQVSRLLAEDPFRAQPPRYIRAQLYRYEYTSPAERRATGAWWKRSLLGDFLQPSSLADLRQLAR
jgi:hypothetical protein